MGELKVSNEEEKRVKGLGFLRNKGTDNFSARVITGNGRITADQHICIGEAAKLFSTTGMITYTTRLTVEVQGIPYEKIEEFRAYIAKAGLETGGTGPKIRPVVSCKGTTCRYGLLDSFGISERIHKEFYVKWHDVTFPHKVKIAVGGCPNNCVKPNLNDIGIAGCPIPAAQQSEYNGCKKGFKVYIGGRWGKKAMQGTPLTRIITDEDELMKVIENTLNVYLKHGNKGERLADMIQRLGFENVEAEILGKN